MSHPAHQQPAETPDAFLERVRFIEHRGKQILFMDLSNIRDPSTAYPLVHKNRTLVSQQPPASLLTMTLVSNAHFDAGIIKALTELVKANKPHVKSAAIVGLTGLQKVIYVTLTQLTGRKIPTFRTIDEAQDWLVSQ